MQTSDLIAGLALVVSVASAGFEFWRWRCDVRDRRLRAAELEPRIEIEYRLDVMDGRVYLVGCVENTGEVPIKYPRLRLYLQGANDEIRVFPFDSGGAVEEPLDRYLDRNFFLSGPDLVAAAEFSDVGRLVFLDGEHEIDALEPDEVRAMVKDIRGKFIPLKLAAPPLGAVATD